MRVIEAEAKRILADRGLATPGSGRIYAASDNVAPALVPVAVKAQTLSGKRAQAGLVLLAPGNEAPAAVARVREAMKQIGETPVVLVESQVDIEIEYYLAWRIDDLQQKYALLFSGAGGTDIEERSDTIHQYFHSPLVDLQPYHLAPTLTAAGVSPANLGAVARFAAALFQVFRDEDAALLEINPVVVTKKGQVVAVDAKLTFDENATKRHGEWRQMISASLRSGEKTELEVVAAAADFTFVELKGPVALFSAGAGLGMCLLDMLADAGVPAANFSDASGGSGPETFARMGQVVFQLAERREVKAIVFFFVLSATSLKSVVDGILHLIAAARPPKPLVIGLMAAGAAERELTLKDAQELIRQRGYHCVSDLADAVEAVRGIVASSSEAARLSNAS